MDITDPFLQLPAWQQAAIAGTVPGALVGGLVIAINRRINRAGSRPRDSRRGEWLLTIVAALIATAVALQGMWQLFDTLGMPLVALVALCGFVEIAMTTSALRARRNLLRYGSTGADGIAVWAFAALNAVLATLEARTLAEHLLRLAAPFVAAWLWHRGMVGEYREISARVRQRITWRITPERILVWLRLAEPGEREIGDVDRVRRRTALARWALRYHTLPDGYRRQLAGWMLRRRGFAAVQHLGLGTDPAVIEEIRTTLGATYALLPGTSPDAVRSTDPWQLATVEPDPEPDPEPDDVLDAEIVVEDVEPEPETVHAESEPAREPVAVHIHARPTVHADPAPDDARTPEDDARPAVDREAVYARWREAELSANEADHWTAKRVGEECGVTAPQGSRIRTAWLVRLNREMEAARLRLVHTS